MASVRTTFLRDTVEALFRLKGDDAIARVRARLSPAVAPLCDPAALRLGSASTVTAIDHHDELLHAIDQVAGDGSGRLLEDLGYETTMRLVAGLGPSAVSPGDLRGSIARLAAPLVAAYVGADARLDVEDTEAGFDLRFGVAGRLRTTRLLRHRLAGAVRAAAAFCREVAPERLRIYAEVVGDRATLTVRWRTPTLRVQVEPDPAPARPPSSLRSSGRFPAPPDVGPSSTGRRAPPPAPPSRRDPEKR